MSKFLIANRLEGSKLSHLSWLVVLLACAFLLPGAYSIDISFSAEDGGESVYLDSEYEVDTDVSVEEECTASFGQPAIENTRSVSGSGDIKAVQSYAGSGGYSGSSNLNAYRASGTLESTVNLAPSTLSANQVAAFSGDSADIGLDLIHRGESVSLSSGMQLGSIDTNQNVWTGSAEGSQATNIFAKSGFVQWTGTFGTSIEKFSGSARAMLTSFMSSLSGEKVKLTDKKTGDGDYSLSRSLKNPDGSQVKVDVDISGADWYSYSYELKPDKQEASEKLTANNAEEIKASASANNKEGDKSRVSIEFFEGSIEDYSNLAHADSTKVDSSQQFTSASGSFYIESDAENKEGDKASANVDVYDGTVKVLNHKSTSTANQAHVTQTADVVYGSIAEINSHAENKARSKQLVKEIEFEGKYKTVAEFLKLPSVIPLEYDHWSNSADFVVLKKDNDKFNSPNIDTTATSNDLSIISKTGTKTALILDPFQVTFDAVSLMFDQQLYFNTIGRTLKDSGYAVTYYSNAGVSGDTIKKQLGDYDISLVRTHGLPYGAGLYFSKYSEMNGDPLIRADEIKPNKKNNMIILDACYSFEPDAKTSPLAKAVADATVSGGHLGKTNAFLNNQFMPKFFEKLCGGDTVKDANDKAASEVWGSKKLLLQGDENYRLFGSDSTSSDWIVYPGEFIQTYIDKAKEGDTITIKPGKYPENLKIPISLTLEGAGSGQDGTILDGSDSGSVISIIGNPDLNINVLLYNMLIRNGLSTLGGGIYNFEGTLTVEDCTIKGNDATQSGGGIYNTGTLTVKDSDISGNTAAYGGAGICNEYGTFKMESGKISDNTASSFGGGIYNVEGSSTINGGTISKNKAYEGGGIYNSNNDFTMNGGTISENSAHSDTSGLSGSGGGVANNGGRFVLNAGTISDNTADYTGGGVWNSGSAFTMKSGTISGNTGGAYGGGVSNYYGTFTMDGGSISGENSAGNGGGVFNNYGTFTMNDGFISGNKATYSAGGGVLGGGGTITMNGGTISENTAKSYGGGVSFVGTFTMNGGTISENSAGTNGGGVDVHDTDGTFIMNAGTISRNNAPLGGGIINYGITTITGDKISQNIATNDGGGIYNDGTLTFKLSDGTVIPQSDSRVANIVFDNHLGSLNGPINNIAPEILKKWMVNPGEFIQHYIDLAKSGDIITIAPGIFVENLVIDKSLTLQGAGSGSDGTVVDGNGLGSVFAIGKFNPDIDVILTNLMITNGIGSSDYILPVGPINYVGGGILNKGRLTVDQCVIQNNGNEAKAVQGYYGMPTYGGGIYSSGALTVTDSVISKNVASYGAGIFLDNYQRPQSDPLIAKITNSDISENSAIGSGGGIFNFAGGDLEITGNTIYGNTARYGRGGGICNYGTLEMGSGIISRSGGSGDGGGVYNGGTFTMKDGSISNNAAYNGPAGTWFTSAGGGVHNSGTFNLEGGSISGNYAHRGGGVYNSGTLNIEGGSINSNIYDAPDGSQWAPYEGGGIYNSGTLNIEGGSISKNTAYNDGGGIFNSGTIYPDYSKCTFGTGADANSPNDHN